MKKLVRLLFVWSCVGASLVVVALSVAGFFGAHGHKLELLSNMRLPLLAASAILMCTSVLVRPRVTAMIPLVGLLINAWVVLPFYLPHARNASAHKLRIATINVWGAHNKSFGRVVDYVRAKNPDIVCVNESSSEWRLELSSRLQDYKYLLHNALGGGALVMSRTPIQEAPDPKLPGAQLEGLRQLVRLDGKQILLMSLHPPDPVKRREEGKRNAEFKVLAQEVREQSQPVIVIGDLNVTPWSPYFQRLLRDGRLEDSEIGFGVQPTWSNLMLVPLLPIDHCLTSDSLVVTRRVVGPAVGSDHLPLCVDVAFKDGR